MRFTECITFLTLSLGISPCSQPLFLPFVSLAYPSSAVSSSVSVRGECQTASACLLSCVLDIKEVFVDVPVCQDVHILNQVARLGSRNGCFSPKVQK